MGDLFYWVMVTGIAGMYWLMTNTRLGLYLFLSLSVGTGFYLFNENNQWLKNSAREPNGQLGHRP